MPVRIGEPEEMSGEEFDALRRTRSSRPLDPNMADVLDRLEAGQAVRVPIGPDQTIRGVRVSIGRLAAQRGMRVEGVEGEGFLAVRRVEEPERKASRQAAAGNGRRRGRRRRTEQADGEAADVAPGSVSVPKTSTTGEDPQAGGLPAGAEGQ